MNSQVAYRLCVLNCDRGLKARDDDLKERWTDGSPALEPKSIDIDTIPTLEPKSIDIGLENREGEAPSEDEVPS
jgi:hypothetical protein